MEEGQSGYQIKVLQSDRDREYISKALDDICKDYGTLHQLKSAYTLQ